MMSDQTIQSQKESSALLQEKLPLKSKLSFGGAISANTIMSQIAYF